MPVLGSDTPSFKLAKTVASDGAPSKQPSSFRHVPSLDGRTDGQIWVKKALEFPIVFKHVHVICKPCNGNVHWQSVWILHCFTQTLTISQLHLSILFNSMSYAMLPYVIYVPLESSYTCFTPALWISGSTQILGFPLVALLRVNESHRAQPLLAAGCLRWCDVRYYRKFGTSRWIR